MSLDELVQYGMKIKKLIKKEKFDDAATILNVLNGMMVFYSFFFGRFRQVQTRVSAGSFWLSFDSFMVEG